MQNLTILFEDKSLLAVDKPPGLVVDKSETQKQDTLEDLLASKYDNFPARAGIVHRLDKDTSGVILIAKTQRVLENLQAQFKERKVKKEYLALVHGMVGKSGRVEGGIGRNPGNREKFMVIPGTSTSKESKPFFEVFSAKEAVTEYEPLNQLTIDNGQWTNIFEDFNKIQMRKLERMKYNQFTLLTCKPKTGRTHQIRVHLKYAGFSIVSDEKYAGRKMVRLDKRWCPRMFLHASKIGFSHPASGQWMELESELPKDLRKVLESLRSLEQYSSSEVEKLP